MDWDKVLNFLRMGFMPELAPSITRGLLIEYLYKVDTKELDRWIKEDVSLWSKVEPRYQDRIRKALSRMGDMKWLTVEWLQEGLRKELPKLCSLFLGSEEALEWLERQLEDIKSRITQPIS
jgi:hypothetical protein